VLCSSSREAGCGCAVCPSFPKSHRQSGRLLRREVANCPLAHARGHVWLAARPVRFRGPRGVRTRKGCRRFLGSRRRWCRLGIRRGVSRWRGRAFLRRPSGVGSGGRVRGRVGCAGRTGIGLQLGAEGFEADAGLGNQPGEGAGLDRSVHRDDNGAVIPSQNHAGTVWRRSMRPSRRRARTASGPETSRGCFTPPRGPGLA